jgi:UDP-N-acetylmuramoyl-tripeptide--D-alanyl-D-alanine ligase
MQPTANISWSLNDILKATGGEILSGKQSIGFSGINIDSRQILPEECFVCLKGDTHDGHQFIPAVIQMGVRGVIADTSALDRTHLTQMEDASITCIGVKDTLLALGDLAAYLRMQSGLSVVALTGSNGKTTTRTMITHVLSRQFKVLAPIRNFNNLVGVPLTLLRIEPDHEWAILELGMNSPGEIRRLGEICSPDIGLITNIGPAHLEGLGSLEAIMEAKGEIIESISSNGTMIFNADDPRVMRLAKRAHCQTVLFGKAPEADIRASSLRSDPHGISFGLHAPQGEVQVQLPLPGLFNVSNALAAAAVATCLKVPLDDMQAALQSFIPVQGRLNLLEFHDKVHLIDDTYNANPASVKAALNTLKGISGDQRCIAVLGDMLELGQAAPNLHHDIGCKTAKSGLDRLYVTGQFAADVAQGAQECGLAPELIFCGSKEEIFEQLENIIAPGDWVLVKGSRGMRMETLVLALKQKHGYVENRT